MRWMIEEQGLKEATTDEPGVGLGVWTATG